MDKHRANVAPVMKRFKCIGNAEGISYLLLLCVAMPIKYLAHIPEPVKVVGWAHGLLFMLYILALFLIALKLKWGFLTIFIGFIASLLPLGPYLFHRYYLKENIHNPNF